MHCPATLAIVPCEMKQKAAGVEIKQMRQINSTAIQLGKSSKRANACNYRKKYEVSILSGEKYYHMIIVYQIQAKE